MTLKDYHVPKSSLTHYIEEEIKVQEKEKI